MRWPQIVVIILYAVSLGIAAAKHGEENYNFWTTLFAVIVKALLLYWGGFWG